MHIIFQDSSLSANIIICSTFHKRVFIFLMEKGLVIKKIQNLNIQKKKNFMQYILSKELRNYLKNRKKKTIKLYAHLCLDIWICPHKPKLREIIILSKIM